MIIESRAYARAGLLGNPSDGYFGKTISIIVKNFGARISLYQSPELHIEPQEQDLTTYRNIYHLRDAVSLTGYNGGIPLIKAAIKKFCEYCEENNTRLSNKNFTVRYASSIPRQVGLAGSSAIIIATMRALMQFYSVKIPLEILPNLALSAEKDELGINAGMQDRVIQSYEGCVYMNFDKKIMEEKKYGQYERIEPALLPKLYIAYKTSLGKVSGTVFNDIRARYDKGDAHVIDTLSKIASLAERGKEVIRQKDYETLFHLMNENFDLRCKIMNISESNMELINTARSCGASASFTGSGGSIIGMYTDDEMLNKLVVKLKNLNARVIKPYIV
ncbi:GHMP kinase [Rhodocytophaga rosea]|uniref:GHMP kinase n=1 Tax=Rhodocytophaga rosea TaxID=2704465 RepID=A0A6C0GQ09_9BACT|nr:GHMP kinase [Rhodocytophaga rosea]QHT69672.1 GHMP kinase [Rhodocytophaga rosea]